MYLLSATAGEVFKYIGYVIVAVLALMVMIVIHELGHYTAGKILGFKIDEFAIGFGPAIIKKRNKKTGELFTLRPFPVGGFCTFHGEDADGAKLDEDGKQIRDEDGNIVKDPDAFNNQKPWKRLIVLFSGAFMNFLSAILIITIYFTAYGQVLPNVVRVHNTSAYQNVFEQGDVILNINGKQVNIMLQEDLDNAFKNLSDSATFTVWRGGKRVKVVANKFFYNPFDNDDFIAAINGDKLETPIKVSDLDSYAAANGIDTTQKISLVVGKLNEKGEFTQTSSMSVQKGVVESDADGYYSYSFGITRSLTHAKLPFFISFGRAWSFCFFIVFKILASLGALITGKVGLESAGGTFTTIKMMAQISSMGFDSFLYVVAIISANLAVMNLLPFPALDGSRMLFTLIEMIFRKPVPRKIEAVIHTVGLVLLLVLAVFLDIFHLVRG